MKMKVIKVPVHRCCECEKIVSVRGSMIRPYSIETNKKTIKKVTCFDCEVKELVCYG